MATHEYTSREDYSSRSLRIRRSLSSGIVTCCIRRSSRGIRVVAAVGILVKVVEHIVSGEWGRDARNFLSQKHSRIEENTIWREGCPNRRYLCNPDLEEWGSHTTSTIRGPTTASKRMGIPHGDSKECAPLSFVSQQKTRSMDEFNPFELGLVFIFSLLLVFSILCYFK